MNKKLELEYKPVPKSECLMWSKRVIDTEKGKIKVYELKKYCLAAGERSHVKKVDITVVDGGGVDGRKNPRHFILRYGHPIDSESTAVLPYTAASTVLQ